MAVIEKKRAEYFVRAVAQARLQVLQRILRRFERVAANQARFQMTPAELERGDELDVFCLADAGRLAQNVLPGGHEITQAAKAVEQLAREIDRGLAGYAGADEERE